MVVDPCRFFQYFSGSIEFPGEAVFQSVGEFFCGDGAAVAEVFPGAGFLFTEVTAAGYGCGGRLVKSSPDGVAGRGVFEDSLKAAVLVPPFPGPCRPVIEESPLVHQPPVGVSLLPGPLFQSVGIDGVEPRLCRGRQRQSHHQP